MTPGNEDLEMFVIQPPGQRRGVWIRTNSFVGVHPTAR